MKSKVALLLALLIGGVGGAVASAVPAQAAYADCPSTMFCIWWDANYTGARWQISESSLIDSPNNGVYVGWIDDEGSSVYNRTGHDIMMFDGANCGPIGWNRTIPTGTHWTAPGTAINDRISSIQRWNAYPLNC